MKTYNTHISNQMEEVARQVIPGGVMSNYRKEEDYHPTYFSRGNGSKIYDVDDNEYIDYSLGMGPNILGHSNAHLRKSLENQIQRLHTMEYSDKMHKAAEKIVAHVPSAEKVRFACSGTEANYNALRTARAYTGRNMYVRFQGHYHGCLDNLIGGIVSDPENPVPIAGAIEGDIFSEMSNTAGRAQHAFKDGFMIGWNDLPALENLFAKFGDDIAAVIMEPVMTNFFGCLPEPGYLEGMRALCTKYGVVLIFDEVLTGFRMGLKGAQGYFDITPDMTTLAKAIGNGFPVSAFCGKKEIMDVITRCEMIAAGTYNGHPIAMAAVIATIEELEKDDGAAVKHIEKLGGLLRDGLGKIAREQEQNLLIQGFPGALVYNFSSKKKIISYKDGLDPGFFKAIEFGGLMKKRGVLCPFRFCTSTAHTVKDVEDTLDRAEDAMKALS